LLQQTLLIEPLVFILELPCFEFLLKQSHPQLVFIPPLGILFSLP